MNRKTSETRGRMGLRNQSRRNFKEDICLAPQVDLKDKKRMTRTSRKFGSDITNMQNAMEQEIPQTQSSLEFVGLIDPPITDQQNEVGPYIPQIKNHMAFIDWKYNSYILDCIKFANNKDITPPMRSILVKWIIQVGEKFRVKPQTLHICIQIIDYVLIVKGMHINKANYQLLGITSLFVSSKFNEIHIFDAQKYVNVCDGQYNLNQMFEMESLILIATDFNLQFPTVIQFAEGMAKDSFLPQKCKSMIKNLSNLCVFDFNLFNKYKKNDLASVVVYLASKIVGLDTVKSKDLIEQIGVESSTFKQCLVCLINIYKQTNSLSKDVRI